MVWRIIPWVICFFWSNMGMIFWDLAVYFISHFAFYWTPMVNIFWWTSYGEHFMVNILWWTFYGEHLMVNWTSCGNIKTALWTALSLRNYFHRALWDTCHSWDMWSEWWGDRLWPSKIQKQWQIQLQKQVQCNGTVIPDKEISFKGTCKHRDTITLTLTFKNNNVKSNMGQHSCNVLVYILPFPLILGIQFVTYDSTGALEYPRISPFWHHAGWNWKHLRNRYHVQGVPKKIFCYIIRDDKRNRNLIVIIIFVCYSENQPTNCAQAQWGFPEADIWWPSSRTSLAH